jgi:NAD(P)-dependent dehydrogenase (short-subunit alcohol dehydrogenase family)
MQVKRKTMIVTGAAQGIGAGVTKAFIERGYNVVANSRKITESEFVPADRLVLIDGNIGEASTAAKISASTTPASSLRSGLRTTPPAISSCSPKRIYRATSISPSLQ